MLETTHLHPHFDDLSEKKWSLLTLDPAFCSKLQRDALDHLKNLHFRNAALAVNQKVEASIRNDQILWLDAASPSLSEVEKEWLLFLERFKLELRENLRISIRDVECHYAHYAAGHFYKRHQDTTSIENKRIFSFVLYLNENWQPKDGGELIGYSDDQILFEIKPELGHMIIFRSDIEHEVQVTNRSRLSLTGMVSMLNPGQKKILTIIFLDRFRYRLLILFLSLMAAVFGLALPYYQKDFSDDLSYATLGICIALSLVYLVLNQLTLFIGQNEAIKAQEKLAETIYSYNMNLKPLTLQNKSVGEVVSLYTTDIPSLTVWLEQSLPYGLTTLFPLVLTPLFLSYSYGLDAGFSFGLVGVLVVLNGLMAYRQSLFFFKFKKLAADRMGLVNEWIQNIRGLKILNWIEGFENKIIRKRREETVNRVAMVTNGQVMNSISSSINFWLNLGILSFFIWMTNKPLTKSDMIALLWVTSVFLSRPLRQLPWFFTFVFDAWTSYKRLAEFLNLKNQDLLAKSNLPKHPNSLVEIEHLNLMYGERKILNDIQLQIQPQELIAVIGPVGAGKTMLMKSIIGETPFRADLYFKRKTSYVPQDHFVMSASLRDNMAFEYHADQSLDPHIMAHLKKAQFDFELDRVHDGLDTIIGERGVNLSGGQKQRVSLARQLMNPEKLLLLDDPLSAVDVITEKKLIAEFKKLKALGFSIMLTTQRFTVLPECDRIIYMMNGRIEFDGPSGVFLTNPKYESFLTGLS